jgi:hypothetical protein
MKTRSGPLQCAHMDMGKGACDRCAHPFRARPGMGFAHTMHLDGSLAREIPDPWQHQLIVQYAHFAAIGAAPTIDLEI